MSESIWESVEMLTDGKQHVDMVQRLPVPGGWLYRTGFISEAGITFALCFVPRPKTSRKEDENLSRVWGES